MEIEPTTFLFAKQASRPESRKRGHASQEPRQQRGGVAYTKPGVEVVYEVTVCPQEEEKNPYFPRLPHKYCWRLTRWLHSHHTMPEVYIMQATHYEEQK